MNWRQRFLRPPRDRMRARMDAAITRLQAAEDDGRLSALAGLVGWLRPWRIKDVAGARERVTILTARMREDAAARAAVRNSLLWLILEKQQLRLLTDSGILAGEGFFGGFWRRMSHGLLPEELDPAQLKDALSLMFTRRDDYVWVDGVEDTVWVEFLDALDLSAAGAAQAPKTPFQILEALLVVSYRIASLGLEPELVRSHPAIERYESPFLTQNVEMRQFIDERQAALSDKREPAIDDKHLLVLLDQCEQIIAKVRKQSAQTGASVSLTVVLARLAQNVARLKLLLQMLEKRPAHELNELRVRFFRQVVRSENRRHSIRELWAQTADLLSARIVSNASKAGEQYITTGRADFFRLFRSAVGAGFIVALAALAKMELLDPSRSPFGQAIVYSALYASAFVLMYVFHFSLATKQPAMTANVIAQTLEGDGAKKRVDALAELMVRTFRSQFIALVGNLVVVVPLAVYIAQEIWRRKGAHYLSAEHAHYLLADVDPLSAHVWVWSALTGICLFATGLISGYYDNKAVYDRVPQRVAQIAWLRRVVGARGAQRIASYVENNLGGLMGSVFFGIMLGSLGAIGRVFGVPMDTLHVTFTAANSAYAMATLGNGLDMQALLPVIAGVSIIGTMNLFVSFSLALYVALRAQRATFDSRRLVLRELALRFYHRPRDFFWPPSDPPMHNED